ncbi:hypothetical protein TIFTF001_042020 [Ficus carica]|uniref:Uncharacterized protein n=1 Tax=Ficus carica TaxID=3494 RepID=A0AA87ZYS6_FICCA|nr:hypothetical protein TIFTF001_042020 [Ficus carica]
MAHQFDNRYLTLPKFVIDCVERRFAAGEDRVVRWSRSSLDTVAHSWLRWFGILGREILSTTNCPTKNSCDFEKLVLYLSRMIARLNLKQ